LKLQKSFYVRVHGYRELYHLKEFFAVLPLTSLLSHCIIKLPCPSVVIIVRSFGAVDRASVNAINFLYVMLRRVIITFVTDYGPPT
jgi:hypothetical protein